MADTYNRYENFTLDGKSTKVPFLKIREVSTDLVIVFNKKRMRLDTLSYKYYGNPDYGWLILQANPSLPSMEFSIPNGSLMRIPYPLSDAIRRYEEAYAEYENQNNDF